MARLRGKAIQELAVQRIAEHPGGLRLSELVGLIRKAHPETGKTEVAAAIAGMDDDRIRRPGRGLYAPAIEPVEKPFRRVRPLRPLSETVGAAIPPAVPEPVPPLKEDDFYGPFAQWLRDDLGEVTVAEALGGSSMGAKWGTPDVIAAYKPLAHDRVKFPIELVSAEVKIDPSQSVVAFGQAMAYRLFSSRTYIVMPRTITEEEKSRLEALCMLLGVGLVLFNMDKAEPDFGVLVRAQRYSPDMFYVNEFADRLFKTHAAMFERVFG